MGSRGRLPAALTGRGVLRTVRAAHRMNIHEYQAKILFDQFSVPNPRGMVAGTVEEAAAAAVDLGGDRVVVKSQVHAGGRGKGTFKSGFQGGVHLVAPDEVAGIADRMLGEILVTKQTGDEAIRKQVRKE